MRLLLVALLVLSPAWAMAGDFMTGTKLLEACRADGAADEGVCIGYVAAVHDVLLYQPVSRRSACPPAEGTLGQYRDIAVSFLENHPEARQYAGMSVVAASFAEAFPCPAAPPARQ